MLEEALKNEKKNPAEVALAMLSYVQVELTAGGTAAESRFYGLFEPLCDRIFGPLVRVKGTTQSGADNNYNISLNKRDFYRHKENGWLSERSPWSLNSTMPRNHANSTASLARPSAGSTKQSGSSIESDPVVKLLGTAGKQLTPDPLPQALIEAISSESVNRPGWGFIFPLDALPETLRESWLATLQNPLPTRELTCTENTRKLLTKLIRRGPLEQHDLIKFCQEKAQNTQHSSMMKLSPRGFHSSVGMQNSVAKSPIKTSSEEIKNGERHRPKVILSMLEYYLMLFLNFPLVKSTAKITPAPQGYASSSITVPSQKQTYGETVYNYLLRKYLHHFLPYEKEGLRDIKLASENSESELFLRIIVSLWLEAHGNVKPTSAVLEAIMDRRARSGQLAPPSFDLDNAYDLVVVHYEPPVAQAQRGLCSVVVHVILDPALSKYAIRENDWKPSAAMETMTQPFLNYIRASFRHASIHQQESSPFFGVLDAWLMWLEPWNVNETKGHDFSPRHAAQRMMGNAENRQKRQKRTLSLPKQNQTSRYSKEWEPYIAANVHMYATPLAIFLRRARELDFSTHKYHRSMRIIERVFRVFTPQVVDAISRSLSGASHYGHLVKRHCDLLGPYAPPGPQSLSSCQKDMKALLEEMHIQRVKKVREMDIVERIESTIEGMFNFGVVSGEERNISKVVERAKAIVQLPLVYSPTTATTTTARSSAEKKPPLLQQGELTDEGFHQVVTGATKIDPSMVGFVGDTSNARLGSYEIQVFVELAGLASDYVFRKTGVRVNFRVLADYRNALALLLPVFLWRLFK